MPDDEFRPPLIGKRVYIARRGRHAMLLPKRLRKYFRASMQLNILLGLIQPENDIAPLLQLVILRTKIHKKDRIGTEFPADATQFADTRRGLKMLSQKQQRMGRVTS